MTSDKLCSRVHHHVGSVLDRTDEERSAECVVNNHYGVVLVGNLRYTVDVGHAGVGMTEGLDDESRGVRFECLIHCLEVGWIYNCCLHALCRKSVLYEVVCSSVEVVGSNDMVAVVSHVLQCVGDGCCS